MPLTELFQPDEDGGPRNASGAAPRQLEHKLLADRNGRPNQWIAQQSCAGTCTD